MERKSFYNKWNEDNAREFLTENNITTILQLRKSNIALYQWINKHKLREKFFGEPARTKVMWSVDIIKQMIDENHIKSMKELMEFDKNAGDWVYRQGLVDVFFERYTPEKLQRRIETEYNERGGRVYVFEKFKDELERWAKEENTRVIDQCWELRCITEYVKYKEEHPDYDKIKVS